MRALCHDVPRSLIPATTTPSSSQPIRTADFLRSVAGANRRSSATLRRRGSDNRYTVIPIFWSSSEAVGTTTRLKLGKRPSSGAHAARYATSKISLNWEIEGQGGVTYSPETICSQCSMTSLARCFGNLFCPLAIRFNLTPPANTTSRPSRDTPRSSPPCPSPLPRPLRLRSRA